MKRQYNDFKQKMLENDHAEPAVPLEKQRTLVHHVSTYHHSVYHPQKPDQLRVVFDSSAEYKGVSLNKVLLSGPDLNTL